MLLPSMVGGVTTGQVGFLEASSDIVAPWLLEGLGAEWDLSDPGWRDFEEAMFALRPRHVTSRNAVIPVGQCWSLLLSNTPLGTDVGVIPSRAARDLGVLAIRAVCEEDSEAEYPARILETFSPDGRPPLMSLRAIVAMDDGGRWIFETRGEPFAFEELDQYDRRRRSDRFTSELLYRYLTELGVPVGNEPDWGRAQLIELARPYPAWAA